MMDARTYPTAAVRRWMKTVVAFRANADDADKRAQVEQFRVKGLPTIVLVHPTGKVLYNESGGLEGDQLMLNLAYGPYKRMIDLYNAQKYEEAAVPMAYLRRYFRDGGEVGDKAETLYKQLKSNKEFVAAYEKAWAAEDARLKPVRENIEKERLARRSKESAELLKEAKRLRLRAKKDEAIRLFRKIAEDYADTPSAEEAKKRLKKLGVEDVD